MTGPSSTWSRVLYLLDANVLITAHRDYYAVARVPEFWHWLQHQAAVGKVKVPVEILEEVKRGRPRKGIDDLLDWLMSADVKDTMPLPVQDASVRGAGAERGWSRGQKRLSALNRPRTTNTPPHPRGYGIRPGPIGSFVRALLGSTPAAMWRT